MTALEAFVQVARLGSVKAAAEELALSTPALSRRIQALERYVGRPLFERRHQALEINPDGQALLDDIAPALDAVSVAMDRIVNGGQQMRLRLAVMPLFASQRLLPLLGNLKQAYPLLQLDIETTPHAVARLGEGLDAAIILAREADPALYVHALGIEHIYFMASRDRLGQRPVRSPDDLNGQTLLIHRDMPTLFEDWKAQIDRPDIHAGQIETYDSGALMLEAAAQGLGIAVMLASHYVHSHDMRLERIFTDEVESPYRYLFVCRPRALQNRAVRVFHDWLIAQTV